jgi:Terpene synthase family, metal binding domain
LSKKTPNSAYSLTVIQKRLDLPYLPRRCQLTLLLLVQWAKLCNAFLVEAKWFANNQVPNTENYLRNGVTSSGVHVVMETIFFILGHRVTNDTVHLIEDDFPLFSCPAKILRLWDDLGSAKVQIIIFYFNYSLICFFYFF